MWINPRPNLVRFCRPMKILRIPETKEIAQIEIGTAEDQIKTIDSTKISGGTASDCVNYPEFVCTMLIVVFTLNVLALC